jgi:hypothetical protein
MDLSNFFSAAEARMDRWSQLNTTARSWESAVKGSRPTEKIKAEATSLVDELGPLEALWAYPGPKLMGTLKERLASGDAVGFARLVQEVVSANLVIPYPPGFPIMVPGQVITRETIDFMRKLDVKEIHGYRAAEGLKVIKPSVLEKAKRAARR